MANSNGGSAIEQLQVWRLLVHIKMIDLIKAATLVNNQELQKNAEGALLKIRTEQPERFFVENGQILMSGELPVAIRQSAGALLSVSLKMRVQNVFLWDRLSVGSKSAFKEAVLGAMIDKEKFVRRAAANIVAAVCCIEIPRKEWEGIAQRICANMSNSDPVVREVSILTIGFICEQLEDFNFTFDERLQETILTGILLGLKQQNPQISQISFKALRDCIPAISYVMKNPTYRDYLINQIAEAVRSGSQVTLGLQCLVEFIRSNFSSMSGTYVEGFANLLDPILKNPADESSCIIAIEFWATFARLEHSIEDNPTQQVYIQGAFADKLVESLLQNLCFIEDGDDEENGVNQAAANALQAIFQGNSEPYKAKVLQFTSNTIKHENWKYRQGSIRAFAILLLGLPQEVSQSLVNASLVQLASLLADSVFAVQIAAIKSLALISEETGSVFLHHANFIDILQLVVSKGQANESFMRHSCKFIDNLCEVPNSSKQIQPICDQLINVFFDACAEPNRTVTSVNNCLCTIISLITNSASCEIANKYIDYVLINFPKIAGLQREKRNAFHAGFFTISQICLMTLRKAGGSLKIQLLSHLYELVVGYFVRIDSVESDGYYVVSALAFFFPQDRRIVDNFWTYIEKGLQRLDQNDIFKATISCICDFSATYKVRISDRIDWTLSHILQLFEKNQVTRELKLDILMCIGQLFLQCGETCGHQLKRVMDIILISIEAVFQIADKNYSEVLQESICETLMCIFHGLSDSTPNQALGEYVKYVFKFVALSTEKSRHPKLDYVKDAMVLLADISSFYTSESRAALTHQFLADRLAILNKYNADGHLTRDITYLRQTFHI